MMSMYKILIIYVNVYGLSVLGPELQNINILRDKISKIKWQTDIYVLSVYAMINYDGNVDRNLTILKKGTNYA